jgi:hypothetical protein
LPWQLRTLYRYIFLTILKVRVTLYTYAHTHTHTHMLIAETLVIMEMDLRSFGERPRPFCQTYIHHIWNVFQNVCRDLSELRHLVWEWRMGTKHCINCHNLHSSARSCSPSTVSLWTMETVSQHPATLSTCHYLYTGTNYM